MIESAGVRLASPKNFFISYDAVCMVSKSVDHEKRGDLFLEVVNMLAALRNDSTVSKRQVSSVVHCPIGLRTHFFAESY